MMHYSTLDSRYVESQGVQEKDQDIENFEILNFMKMLEKIGKKFECLKCCIILILSVLIIYIHIYQ